MRRYMRLISFLLALVILTAGCTDRGGTSDPGPDPGDPEIVEKGEEQEILELLDGEWRYLPMGRMVSSLEDSETLEFSCGTGELGFARKGLTDYVICDFELGMTGNSSRGGYDLIKVTPKEVTEGYTAIGDMILDYGPEFQFFVRQVGDRDVLILRDLTEWSPLVQYGLTYEGVAIDGFYVFERATKQSVMTADEQDALVRKRATFYAMRYVNSAGVMYLQELDGYEHFVESNCKYVPVVSLVPVKGEGRTRTVRYSGNSATESGSIVGYMPQLMKISTDADGRLSLITVPMYYGHGMYFRPGVDYSEYLSEPEGPNGAGDDYRDPARYERGDSFFLGRWEDVSDDVNYFVVDYGSPQVGGYEINYAFRMSGSGTGYANLTSDPKVLHINQAESSGKYWEGDFRINGDGTATLTVTSSETIEMWEGRTATYERVYG